MATSALRKSASQLLRSASSIVCLPSATTSHVLRIQGYSHLKETVAHGKYVRSRDFDAGGHAWRLRYFPNGYDSKSILDSDYKDHISVFLELAGDEDDDQLVPARARVSLLDRSENPAFLRSPTITESFEYGSNRVDLWGFPDFVTRAEVEKPKYLKDDQIDIQCDVSVPIVRNCTQKLELMDRS